MPDFEQDPEVVLQTVNLTREYRVGRQSVTALEDVEITIRQGEFVAIMGPSGCGKSTLINLIGGLDSPTSGRVLLKGQDLSQLSEEELAALRRENMGFVFQRHDLFPVLTARENVEFPLLLSGGPADHRKAKAENLLSMVGLTDKADHLPEELSAGQQQRVGIARALANASSILLADEPTGNLDSLTAEEVVSSLIDLAQKRKLTLLMVTHDPDVAAHADRILQLKDGRLLSDDGRSS
jgi:ABC-type lipoprotein export system ATPase subunit